MLIVLGATSYILFFEPLHASILPILFAREVLPYPFQIASFLLHSSSSKEQTPPLTDPVTEVDVSPAVQTLGLPHWWRGRVQSVQSTCFNKCRWLFACCFSDFSSPFQSFVQYLSGNMGTFIR